MKAREVQGALLSSNPVWNKQVLEKKYPIFSAWGIQGARRGLRGAERLISGSGYHGPERVKGQDYIPFGGFGECSE